MAGNRDILISGSWSLFFNIVHLILSLTYVADLYYISLSKSKIILSRLNAADVVADGTKNIQ